MPSDGDKPGARRSFRTTRLEAFSDGVFAIAITLLVLELAIHPPGTPLQQVLHAWPAFLGYLVSFLTIGAGWLGHTAMTDHLERADSLLLRINLLLLLAVAFLPFPTRLVAEALHDVEGERVFVTMYGLTLLAIRLLGSTMDAYARREGLYSTDTDEELNAERKQLLPVLAGYLIAIGLGLVAPKLAVAFYFGIAVFLVVPFREVGRLVFRRSG